MLEDPPCAVEDGDLVVCQVGVHAAVLRFEDKVVEGDEHAPGEEDEAERTTEERRLEQWLKEGAQLPRLGDRGDARLNGEEGDEEEAEEYECAGTHHPWEADLREETRDEDALFSDMVSCRNSKLDVKCDMERSRGRESSRY